MHLVTDLDSNRLDTKGLYQEVSITEISPGIEFSCTWSALAAGSAQRCVYVGATLVPVSVTVFVPAPPPPVTFSVAVFA